MRDSHQIAIERLRTEMDARGWSGKKVAERARLTPPQFSRILTGKTSPGLEVLDRLSEALGVPTWSLLRSPKEQEPSQRWADRIRPMLEGASASLIQDVLKWLCSSPKDYQLRVVLGAIRGMASGKAGLQNDLHRLKVAKRPR